MWVLVELRSYRGKTRRRLTGVAAEPPRILGQTVSEGGGPLKFFVRLAQSVVISIDNDNKVLKSTEQAKY